MNWHDVLTPDTWSGRFDLFLFFRWWLAVVCCIYALIVTLRSLLGMVDFLSRPDRMIGMLRQYIFVQLLRLRLRRFRSELLQIAGWLVVFVLLIQAHGWLGV